MKDIYPIKSGVYKGRLTCLGSYLYTNNHIEAQDIAKFNEIGRLMIERVEVEAEEMAKELERTSVK